MNAQPIKIAILAMGGEGGGVLADWIVSLGESAGYIAQTTSVPGVAQRTGATIYYVELFPKSVADLAGQAPVLALMPLPGDVDVVLASELMEAGRAVQRGLVTPDRTLLIASSHRVYSIAEKSAMGDGRVDSAQLLSHAAQAAKRFVCFDMAEAAQKAGSVISAVLFGALAGSGALPFSREQFEATIERGGIGVKASLKAFHAAYGRGGAVDGDSPSPEGGLSREGGGMGVEAPPTDFPSAPVDGLDRLVDAPRPHSDDPSIQSLIERVAQRFPQSLHGVLWQGIRRLVDYQDVAYADLYLTRLERIGEQAGEAKFELLRETARHLALWMSYEDTARVADLKTRASRFERVRAESSAGQNLLHIHEFMHPRLQEVCETLPAPMGRWLMRTPWARGMVERATRQGRRIHTNSIRGYLMMRAVAMAARWRLRSLRYERENAMIERWLGLVGAKAAREPELALEIVRCQRVVKGYSDTHERGLRSYRLLMEGIRQAGDALTPAMLKAWRDAALADEHGQRLRAALAASGMALDEGGQSEDEGAHRHG
ncbi:MAG: indolepyruvate oxidoreductase subunit beta family protein [Lautropia sp.]|nr:indolepyruvate oxidoreductase subunit beta family protein [Lautropia sp.]